METNQNNPLHLPPPGALPRINHTKPMCHRARTTHAQTRPQKKFIQFLSPEAQLAMAQAEQDTVTIRQTSSAHARATSPPKRHHEHHKKRKHLNKRQHTSFSELFERTSSRLDGDITQQRPHTHQHHREYHGLHGNHGLVHRRALGNQKLDNAMELVEHVNRDAPFTHKHPFDELLDEDDKIIEEIARRNALDKCHVWMQSQEQFHENPPGDHDDDHLLDE